MRKAADKLGLRYARVPMGGETCEFCIMLASRGFVYTSADNAGEGTHYHTHCRCKIIPGKKGSSVEGYDPNSLYKQWKGMKIVDFDKQKLSKYSLNPDHPANGGKAKAWKEFLGYILGDEQEIMSQVYEWMVDHKPISSGENEKGQKRFQSDIPMEGKNGKIENVRVGWVLEKSGKYRLTTIFVKPLGG